MVKIGVVGYGYWGPNLVRNFSSVDNCEVARVVDANELRLQTVKKLYPNTDTSTSFDSLINDPSIDGIIIALPVAEHYEFAKKALLKNKDVLIEKPMANSVDKAQELISIAKKMGRILMIDHTFIYTSAVRKIKDLIDNDFIGEINYFDSLRINLGLFQRDINVIWDLVPHDLSILNFLLKEKPTSVIATGISHTSNNIENIAYITLFFKSKLIAHFNVSWTSPVKIRQILIGGSKKMILYNDLESTEKIKVYDTGFSVTNHVNENKILVDYRVGDIFVPKVELVEALKLVAEDFVNSILKRCEPISNGNMGLEVVKVLEAAEHSIKNRGKEIEIN